MIYYNGVSYKDVKIKHFARLLKAFNEFLKLGKVKNYVSLVTCNRIELYSEENVKIKGFKQKKGKLVLEHLFKVVAGIDSMIIGENEISVQVKDAFEKAKKEKHCSSELSEVFERALKTGKRVRSKTKINHGKVSVASISVDEIVKRLRPKKVLVIGSGMLASKIAITLSNKKVKEIILSNRHYKRAKDLAKKILSKEI